MLMTLERHLTPYTCSHVLPSESASKLNAVLFSDDAVEQVYS